MANYFGDPRKSNMAQAALPLGQTRDALLAKLEGAKFLLKTGYTSFQASPMNLALVRQQWPQLPVNAPALAAPARLQLLRQRQTYTPRTAPFGEYQQTAFDRAKDVEYFALFMDTGTGKTKVALDVVGHQFARGEITGLLVITMKGVHAQWVGLEADSPLPRHLGFTDGKPIHYQAAAWDGKKAPAWFATKPDPYVLEVFAVNFAGLRSNLGSQAVLAFMHRHEHRLATYVDESHNICNFGSQQSDNCITIGQRSARRLIMSGTPVPKNPEDEWVQSLFMSESIFQCRYQVTFRNTYATRVEQGKVLGWKNIEQFRATMAPHVFRITKDKALGLPPKIYDKFYFDLDPIARQHYNELKRNFLTKLRDPSEEIVTVQNAAVLLMRLQQIGSGTLVGEDGQHHPLVNNRLVALEELLQGRLAEKQKIIVWARFRQDASDLRRLLNKLSPNAPVGLLVGGLSTDEREALIAAWQQTNMRFIIGNPQAGGTGTDGLQYGDPTVIYYTNSFNSVERWQSEDRTNRIGSSMTESTLYIDLIAKGTIDEKILKNLREKRDMADFVLGDFEELLA